MASVVGYQLWQEDLGGEADLAKLHLTYNGRTYSVIGVMPPSIHYPFDADLWLAMPRAQRSARPTVSIGCTPLITAQARRHRARVKGQLDALAGEMALRYDGDRMDFRLSAGIADARHGPARRRRDRHGDRLGARADRRLPEPGQPHARPRPRPAAGTGRPHRARREPRRDHAPRARGVRIAFRGRRPLGSTALRVGSEARRGRTCRR